MLNPGSLEQQNAKRDSILRTSIRRAVTTSNPLAADVSVLCIQQNKSELQAFQSKLHALAGCCVQARKVFCAHNLWHRAWLIKTALWMRH